MVAKPSLLYASPLPPQRTGIAAYSRVLIAALDEFFEITLYTDNQDQLDRDLAQFPILRHGKDRVDFDSFDYRLYHIGNNPWFHGYIYEAAMLHPGWIVLHEFVLYFLVIGLYRDRPDLFRRIFKIGGAPAVAALKNMVRDGIDFFQFPHPETVPLSTELLCSGNRILVHSEYTRSLVQQVAPQTPVFRTHHAQAEVAATPSGVREKYLARWGLPTNAVLLTSFGFVASTKLNHVVCRVIDRIARDRGAPIYYVMVGQGNCAGSDSERVRITGFVSDSEFDEYLAASDLVINLRYPVMGETSGALLHALALGKPCIVTDLGWFSELPDNSVLKLEASSLDLIEEYLYEALNLFLDCPQPFRAMGEAAKSYIRRRHAPAVIAGQYFDLMTAAAPSALLRC